jgi:hypothetical protein
MPKPYLEDFLNPQQFQLVQDLLDSFNIFFPFHKEKMEGTMEAEDRIGVNFTSQKIIEFPDDQKLTTFTRKQLGYFPTKLTNFQIIRNLIKPHITKTLILHTGFEKSPAARYPIFYKNRTGIPINDFPGTAFVLQFYDENQKVLLYKASPIFKFTQKSGDTSPFWTFRILPYMFAVTQTSPEERPNRRTLVLPKSKDIVNHSESIKNFLDYDNIGSLRFKSINNTMENQISIYLGDIDEL